MVHIKTWIKKLLPITGFLLLLSCSIFSQDRTWTPFSPPNGAWSILAPGTLTADSEALKSSSKQGSYTYNDFSGFFAVIYKDYSKLNIFPWKKAHFTKQRDLVIKANKATLIKDEEFTNGNITGREVRIRMPDNRIFPRETAIKPQHRVQRFRMFFQGNRFYMILAVLPETDINSPEINNYLNSFTFK